MFNLRSLVLVAGLCATGLALAVTPRTIEATPGPAAHAGIVSPESYLVYVDPPTGYTFIKTPLGWKFKGQLPPERMDSLPAGIYTRLVAPVSVTAGSARSALAPDLE